MSSAQPYDPYNPFSNDAAAELNNEEPTPYNHNVSSQSKSQKHLQDLQQTLDDTAGMMRDNINAINERGEVLENIDNQAYSLQNNASLFNKSANQVRKDLWKKNLKLKLCVALIVIIILIVIIVPLVIHFSN